ncbi:MAG: hypothetical protein A3C07_04630 [Candidatus Sungbacteria bacterium RIFCSPHIGHO2_02_FULL_47_11]|uniref:Cytochrome c domain-containing protein n=1 Tax=Candidatus Sungbacteria bacterium RIFCSPHIGHO2_02_FULL_47_11 TaxID=1802270 RepID=A0A1G2KJV7_9BACT|nr:MAG: hypothetical protein A3C07_04630 [Candidatus Sungbacteria bacterium RIFCSPHIGHO2_02_FULL_47_11]
MFARIFFLLFLVFFSISRMGWAEEAASNSCLTCHSDMWEEVKGSAHSQQGIYCNKCHGGDPTKDDKDLAKGPGTGYIGIPDKKQAMELCGSCHSDVSVMNFYGTSTDQLAQYKTSHHGKKLLEEGNAKVAVCSDCHGYHEVLKVSDPNSSVYPSNLPKTCAKCHGNEKLMHSFGLPSDVFEKYKNSVHGKALFEKGDTSVANCASCHGSHGAVPPGFREVGATCGKCHINEKANFQESVHALISDREKFSECVSCHSNHDIQPVSVALYDQACVKCHTPESKAFQQGRQIKAILQKADSELKETRQILKQAGIEGFFIEEEEAILEEVRSKVLEMQPLQHKLIYNELADLYAQSDAKIKEIKASIDGKRKGLKWRKVGLIVLWIFILIMVWALNSEYKRIMAEEKAKQKSGE